MPEYRYLGCEAVDRNDGLRNYSIKIMCKSLRWCGLLGSIEENVTYSGDHADWREIPSNRKVNGRVERMLNHLLSKFKIEEKSRKN